MMNRQTKPFVLVLIALVTTTMVVSIAKGQTPVPPSVTALPVSSPTPYHTPSLEERLDILESQVSDLNEKTKISRCKELADIIQDAFAVIGIIVSGIWAYWLFVQKRQRYPRASIAHRIAHRSIGNEKVLLHVTVSISNIGDILLSLVNLETRIQQVLPPPAEVLDSINKGLNPVPEGEREIVWPLIDSQELELRKGEYEVEPGESQEIHHDFILDADVQTVAVYSYLKNEKKRGRDIGWDLTTLYDLRGIEGVSSRVLGSESND